MPQGICRLCREQAELQLSHVVPAFVYRWLRESSGNGHIRSSQSPNRRIQDGPQEHWLCTNCERRFGRVETTFANQLFHPYLAASGQRFHYGDWLLQFCVSVSWRVLQYHLTRDNNSGFDQTAIARLELAEATWRSFLLGQAPHPGAFRQHLIPLDGIESATFDLPPNINRYLMRAVHIDLCHGGDTVFVYLKLGRFMILGFVNEPNPNHWSGSRVNANQGAVEPRHYTFPAPFRDYLIDKANSTSAALASVSDRQRTRIDEAFRSNIDRFVGSDSFHAMDADVQMFGHAAFSSGLSDDASDR